jgi:hypothetical protein
MMNGKGVKIFPDNSEYSGDFVDGVFQGHGKFKWSDGTIYDGKWVGNKINGEGTKYLNNGCIIHGNFVSKDYATGKGYKKWVICEQDYIFKGNLINSEIGDEGEFTWPNGKTYTGSFKGCEMNGNGTLVWIDKNYGKNVYKGNFTNNKFEVLANIG